MQAGSDSPLSDVQDVMLYSLVDTLRSAVALGNGLFMLYIASGSSIIRRSFILSRRYIANSTTPPYIDSKWVG
jgi:hypothetical protein